MQYGPNPDAVYPNEAIKSVYSTKNVTTHPNILVGDYTYYGGIHGPECFGKHATHHYEFLGDKPITGEFCTIAKGIELVMNGTNHRIRSVATYPSDIIGSGRKESIPSLDGLPFKDDTIVGNDAWIKQNATVMPGVHTDDGAIITANSVVTKDIPAYCIAGGNFCKVIKKRSDGDLTKYLPQLQWRSWSVEKIFERLNILCSADLEKIRTIEEQ